METLTKGLRPTKKLGSNTNYLTTCKFVKTSPFGLIEDIGVTNPFKTDQFSTWPHPQLIRGKGVTLLCGGYSIKEIDETDWSIGTPVILYDTDDLHQRIIIDPGIWHFADFHDVFMLMNGNCTIFKTNHKGMLGDIDRYLYQDELTIQTGCDFKGRLMLGGFNPENFWSSVWESVWGEWTSKFAFGIDASIELAENFVFWTTVGGGDAFHLFMPQKAQRSIIAEDQNTDQMFLEYWRKNSIGFMPVPWQGTVLKMIPLGNGVIAYGDNGIAAMNTVLEPMPTFGMQKLNDFGIAGRGAAGGNDKVQIFIDEAGSLWRMGVDFIPTRLGYEEYLVDILEDDIVISFDPQRTEFYISGKNQSFVLTQTGLSESPHRVTSVQFAAGALLGVSQHIQEDAVDDTEVLLVTSALDFKYRDLKSITTVELGLEIDSEAVIEIAADYKYNTGTEWSRTKFVRVNKEGWARLDINAHDLRLVIRLSNYTDFKLSYVNLKWQARGRLARRGLSDKQANA